MSLSGRHTVGRAIVAALLFTVSAGFTVAHHACSMKQTSCCEQMPAGGPMKGALPHQGESLARPAMVCCTSSALGGLANLTALLEKQSDNQKSAVVPVAILAPSRSLPEPEVVIVPASARPAPPPAVEKYVLFASLLI